MCEASPPSCPDEVIGGFTVISEKVKHRVENVQVALPSWIANCTTFSDDLFLTKPVDSIEEITLFIRECLLDLSIKELFPVQYSVIPFILKSYRVSKYRSSCRPRDVCICAPTGSGKTLAYLVPIVQLLLHRKRIYVRALIILPVRDLAVQIHKVLSQLTRNTALKVVLLAGIQSFSKEQSDLIDSSDGYLCSKADIVVVTPGRLVDHIYNTPGFNLDRLRFLVIDEADRVISEEKQDWYHALEESLYYPSDFTHEDMQYKWKHVKRLRPIPTIEYHCDISHDITLQKILVSATLTHDPGLLKQFNLYFPCLFTSTTSQTLLTDNGTCRFYSHPNAEIDRSAQQTREPHSDTKGSHDNFNVDTSVGIGSFTTPFGLKEFLICIRLEHRALFLVHLIRHRGMNGILCFTNARVTAKRLHLLMKNFSDIEVSCLSCQMPPGKRQRILKSFSSGKHQLLICTDAMARGMDIPNVQCVVSYEMPKSVKIYVHRVGRTARAGRSGVAYTLLLRNQFFHFKQDLKKVGKNKIREMPFHSSQMSDLQIEYENALSKLESTVKSTTIRRSVFRLHNNHSQFNDIDKGN